MIRSLTNDDGEVPSSFSQISTKAISFFQRLIGTIDPQVQGCSKQLLAKIIQNFLPTEAAIELCKPVTSQEIRSTMFAIGNDKAPRLDGFTTQFFKVAWNIVGENVTTTVLRFFHTGKLSSAFNATSVTLVPKIQNPSCIKDYRPISCCSVIYKCITKIMANRLKVYMPLLVSKNQSAFILGRSIVDNILMA